MGLIFKILKCIGPPLKYIEYHKKLKNWLENVEMIIHNAKNVEQTFKNGKYLSRVRQAKLVEKKIQQVQEYLHKGNSFNTLVIDASSGFGTILPTTPLVGETTAKKNVEEIWRHLMDKDIKNIGIFGMGGVGKTTIVTHINNRLVEENKFHNVIRVSISQTPDLVKIQNGIANALKQSLLGIEDHKIRAGKLLSMSREKIFNGCKLVITTRSLYVCCSMNCKTALDLFFEKAELDISKVPTLKETSKRLVKQCASLLLVIVTIASNLNGEEDKREWRNALNELTNNFSYDRLKEEKIQHCFLYYSLYPEYHNIPKTELVNCWIAEGLVQEMDNLQAIEDRAYIMIKILVNNYRSRVKLHNVARDMVLRYITSKSSLFMVKVGLHLKDIQESFLSQMNGLMIMNLSETKIESLPNSISELTSSKLLALRILDLEFTEINVPTGMEMLTNLTSLDLFSMELHKIPAGIFLKLCRLQKALAVEEAVRLKNLDCVMAQFRNLQDFNCYVKSLNSHGGPNEYYLFLFPKNMKVLPSTWRLSLTVNKVVTLSWFNICGKEEKDCVDDIPTFNTLERLEILLICHYVAEFNIYSSNGVMVCDSLQEIVIWDCPQLKRLSLYLPKIRISRRLWEALEWDHLHPVLKISYFPYVNSINEVR
ncbi:hypothetical protein ACOSQ4_021459 [Xanthoceras sorbifolium]